MIFKVSLLVISQSLTLVNSSFSHIVNLCRQQIKKEIKFSRCFSNIVDMQQKK